MKDYKLKVNPKRIDCEMENHDFDSNFLRFIAILLFGVTMLIGALDNTVKEYEYIIKDGHTKKEFMEYYKEMYIMYAGNGGLGDTTTATDLAIEEARGIYCNKKEIFRKSIYKHPTFIMFIISSVLIFLSPNILRMLIHRKLLNQLKYDRGEENRIKAEKFEKILADPTFDPLNKGGENIQDLYNLAFTSKRK